MNQNSKVQLNGAVSLGTDQMNENKSDDDLKRLYTDIKSIPNYSAKLNEFLRQNDVHSKHRRIAKKKFPRRHIIVHFPFVKHYFRKGSIFSKNS